MDWALANFCRAGDQVNLIHVIPRCVTLHARSVTPNPVRQLMLFYTRMLLCSHTHGPAQPPPPAPHIPSHTLAYQKHRSPIGSCTHAHAEPRTMHAPRPCFPLTSASTTLTRHITLSATLTPPITLSTPLSPPINRQRPAHGVLLQAPPRHHHHLRFRLGAPAACGPAAGGLVPRGGAWHSPPCPLLGSATRPLIRPDTHPHFASAAARRLSFPFRRYAVTSTYAPEQLGQDRPDPRREASSRAAGPHCWIDVYQCTRTHSFQRTRLEVQRTKTQGEVRFPRCKKHPDQRRPTTDSIRSTPTDHRLTAIKPVRTWSVG